VITFEDDNDIVVDGNDHVDNDHVDNDDDDSYNAVDK